MKLDLNNLEGVSAEQQASIEAFLSTQTGMGAEQTVVAEVFAKVNLGQFIAEDGRMVLNYDTNNRFILGRPGMLHQYRERESAEWEKESLLVQTGASSLHRFFLFPKLNDYGVEDIFLSVLVVDGFMI